MVLDVILDGGLVAESLELLEVARVLHGDVLLAEESPPEVEGHVPRAQLPCPLHQLHGADEH